MSVVTCAIESARLRLRQYVDADAPFILELLTDPEFLRHIGDRGVHDIADAQRYIRESPGASYSRYGFGLYALERKDGGPVLGMCGLLRRDTHPDVELGFALLPAARGHGYAREAAAATLRYAVQELQLTRLVALTAPDNTASIRILNELGFRFERMAKLSPSGPSRVFVFEAAKPS